MIDIAKLKNHIYDVVGAIHEVHKELGPGLSEYCYQEGLQMQLGEQQIVFQREKIFHPTYHGRLLHAEYRMDFLCKEDIIVECKSVTELPCGILVNFAPIFAKIERYFYDDELKEILTVDGKMVRLSA